MTRLPLRVRLVVLLVLFASLILGGVWGALRHETLEAVAEGLDVALRAQARQVAARHGAHDPGVPPSREKTGIEAGRRGFQILDPETFAVLDASPSAHDFAAPERLLVDARERGAEGEFATVPVEGAPSLRVFARSRSTVGDDASERVVLVVVYESLALVEHEMGEVLDHFLACVPPVLVLALAGALWIAHGIARPLDAIAAAAEHTEATGAAAALPRTRNGDEIDRLAGTLERTFGRLRAAFERQGRFTADAAHELRTPIAAMLSRADIALRRPRSDEEYRAALGDVRDAARRAGTTVEGLLLLARLDDGSDSGVDLDLRSIVEDECEAARRREGGGVPVRLDAADAAVMIHANAAQVAAVVRNLLENALSHGRSEGGVAVTLASDGTTARLSVADRGPGIPPEHAQSVFERFHRVDAARSRESGGNGLGLSIVREVAERWGGRAALVSRPGGGTTVTVELPLV